MDFSLPSGVEAEVEKDVISAPRGPLESGVYKGVIEQVYVDKWPSGAERANIHLKHDGRTTKYEINISSKPENGNVRYTYVKNGKTFEMPGYAEMNRFLKAVINQDLATTANERKTVKIYNYKTKTEDNVEVSVFPECIGKSIAVGILKVYEEGTTAESGYNDGTGKFYIKNKFDKYFDADTGLTVPEKQANITEPEYLGKWRKSNDGKPRATYAKNSEFKATGQKPWDIVDDSKSETASAAPVQKKEIFS